MNIVFSSDQGFVRQLLVASGSAVYASRGGTEPIIVHVLDCGIEEPTWNDYASRITCLAERVHVKTDLVRHVIDMKQFENFNGWTNGSKATWARLLVPNLLVGVDQCVYSDCDMLFIANSIEMLEPLKDPNILIAGHHDVPATCRSDADWCRSKGLHVNENGYVCAGLLAMNLSAFRAEGIVEKCFDFADRYSDLPFMDQTILNQVCFGRRALFPDGWGAFPCECRSLNEQLFKAIHFTSCFCYLWKTTCSTTREVLSLRFQRTQPSPWRVFETHILNLPPLDPKPTPRLFWRTMLLLFFVRLANLLGIKIGHGRLGRLQQFVATYAGRVPAFEKARQNLIGDIDRWK